MIPTPKTKFGKIKLTVRFNTKGTYRKQTEHIFPNRRPLSYPNLTKYMKTYIRCKQHKNSTPKHKTIRTTTEVAGVSLN